MLIKKSYSIVHVSFIVANIMFMTALADSKILPNYKIFDIDDLVDKKFVTGLTIANINNFNQVSGVFYDLWFIDAQNTFSISSFLGFKQKYRISQKSDMPKFMKGDYIVFYESRIELGYFSNSDVVSTDNFVNVIIKPGLFGSVSGKFGLDRLYSSIYIILGLRTGSIDVSVENDYDTLSSQSYNSKFLSPLFGIGLSLDLTNKSSLVLEQQYTLNGYDETYEDINFIGLHHYEYLYSNLNQVISSVSIEYYFD